MTDTESTPPTVSNVGIKYGLFSAAVGILIFLGLALSGINAFDQKWGYLRICISMVFLVLAHREFKQSGDGFMSYGQGFLIGLMMTIVGMIVGFLFIWIYASFVDTGVMEIFYDAMRAEMEAKGTADNQIDIALEWTKKLFWPFAIVGALIMNLAGTAIITIFTQKRNPEPGI